MSELLDAVGQAADQNVDQMHSAETLPGAIGTGQQLLRDDFAVAKLRRRQAVVAIAALGGLGMFAKISEQADAAAFGRFGKANQSFELADRDPLERFGACGLLY